MAKVRSEVSLPPMTAAAADPAGAEFWPTIRSLLDCDQPNLDQAAALLAKEGLGDRARATLFAAILAEHRKLKPLAASLEQVQSDFVAAEHRLAALLRYQARSLDEATQQAADVDAAQREKARLMNLVGVSFEAVSHCAWLTQFCWQLFGAERPARILGQMPESCRPFLVAVGADPMTLDSWLPRNQTEQPRRRARLFTPDRPRN